MWQLEVVDVLEVFGEVVTSPELLVAEVTAVDGHLVQVNLFHVPDHCASEPGAELAAFVLTELLVGRAMDQEVVGQVSRGLGAVVAEIAAEQLGIGMLERKKKQPWIQRL